MPDLRTPEQWCQQYDRTVRDPDGWRKDGKPWDEPISLPEFWDRFGGSTVDLITTKQAAEIVTAVRAIRVAERKQQERDEEKAPAEPDTHTAELTGIDTYAERLDNLGQQLAQLGQLVQTLLQVHPQCAVCAAELRQGARPAANVVNVIVDGTGLCHDHVDVVSGRLVPKTGSGLILGAR